MDLIMQTWLGRGLSLYGKTLVCNTLLSSLLTYKIAVLPTLSEIWYKNYQKNIRNFIWNNKGSHISMKVLCGNKKDGGLGLIDLRKRDIALKLNWVNRYSKNTTIKLIANEMLGNRIDDLIWQISLKPGDICCVFL